METDRVSLNLMMTELSFWIATVRKAKELLDNGFLMQMRIPLAE